MRIDIECQMTNPPKPVGFGIRIGNKLHGPFSRQELIEAFLDALLRWEKLEEAYEARKPGEETSITCYVQADNGSG